MKTNIQFWSYLAQFFPEWEMFQTKVVEKLKTSILCSVTFFSKIVPFMNNMNKYRAGQATHNDMAHAYNVLGTYGYKHTFRVCNARLLFHCNNGCTNASKC